MLAAWACYLPLGARYAAFFLCAGLAVAWVHRQRLWSSLVLTRRAKLLLALAAWMAVSALWSPAPLPRIIAPLWMALLPLALLPLAMAVPAALSAHAARRALLHFVAASALVGSWTVVDFVLAVPDTSPLASPVDATGNQRILVSMLLALGCAFGLWLATQACSTRQRWACAAAAGMALAGLLLQDRRSGLLMLPILLMAWAVAAAPRWYLKLALPLLVAAAAVGTWALSTGVQQRFAEGARELQTYAGNDQVATSWGMRLRLWQRTADMVAERPLTGHGLGSWPQWWRQNTQSGTLLHEHTTPHNEYLLAAAQAGVPAALLLLAWLLANVWASAAAGAVPALMVWTTLLTTACTHAVLRDAKLALPLLLLAALCMAMVPQARGKA